MTVLWHKKCTQSCCNPVKKIFS